jgi:hypothetical protein
VIDRYVHWVTAVREHASADNENIWRSQFGNKVLPGCDKVGFVPDIALGRSECPSHIRDFSL